MTSDRRPREVLIVVPACNEEEGIATTIASLERARRALPSSVTSRLVVVADGCTDGTVAIARRRVRAGLDVVIDAADRHGAGGARRLGTDVALGFARCAPDQTWLANTDADTVVPDDWLRVQLALASSGASAVAGTVTLVPNDEHDAVGALVNERFRRTYEVSADGTHGHVHGANLGVRASCYLRSGGWRPLPTGEDHDLWRRLRVRGGVISTTAVPVVTSARRLGRAPRGFAAGLAELAEAVA